MLESIKRGLKVPQRISDRYNLVILGFDDRDPPTAVALNILRAHEPDDTAEAVPGGTNAGDRTSEDRVRSDWPSSSATGAACEPVVDFAP